MRIGLLPLDGPTPTVQALDRRLDIAKLILSLAEGEEESQTHQEQVKEIQERLHTAYRDCVENLPEVLRTRKDLQKPEVDNWKELEGEILNKLLDPSLPTQDGIATQLSDILPCCRASRPKTLSVAEARRVTQALYEGDISPQKESQGRGLTLWAPLNPRVLGCLLSAYQSYSDNTQPLGPLRLILPMELLPGCDTPENTGFIFSYTHGHQMDPDY